MGEYTAKDIILGTKDKLGELANKLRRLEELTCTERDRRIHYVDYDIFAYDDMKPEIRCIVNEKFWGLRGMIKNTRLYQNLRSHGSESAIISRDNNGNCYILNDKYNLFVPDRKQEEFGTIIDEILTDEFTNNFLKQHYYSSPDKNTQYMFVEPKTVSIYKDHSAFLLHPGENTANFETFDGYIPRKDMLEESLNMPIDEKYLSDYGREIIDTSKARKKEIIIPKYDINSCDIYFDVEEDEKGITLIKK